MFTAYEMFFGKPIHKLDKEGIILEILNSDLSENNKVRKINDRMNYLEEKNIIKPIKLYDLSKEKRK